MVKQAIKSEPVVVITAVTAFIEAGIHLAVGFGVDWSAEQVSLVMTTVVAAGAVISALCTRRLVSPVEPRRPRRPWEYS